MILPLSLLVDRIERLEESCKQQPEWRKMKRMHRRQRGSWVRTVVPSCWLFLGRNQLRKRPCFSGVFFSLLFPNPMLLSLNLPCSSASTPVVTPSPFFNHLLLWYFSLLFFNQRLLMKYLISTSSSNLMT